MYNGNAAVRNMRKWWTLLCLHKRAALNHFSLYHFLHKQSLGSEVIYIGSLWDIKVHIMGYRVGIHDWPYLIQKLLIPLNEKLLIFYPVGVLFYENKQLKSVDKPMSGVQRENTLKRAARKQLGRIVRSAPSLLLSVIPCLPDDWYF